MEGALHAISFDWSSFFDYLIPLGDRELFWRALFTTVYVSVIAQVAGTLLGVLAALGGMSRYLPLRVVAWGYIWFIRGTPVIVQIFFWYVGINLFPRTLELGPVELQGAVVAGIVALAINEGAYMAEIVRAGITSIDRGQTEAALSVGMKQGEAMRRIVLPQAARVIMPGLGNEFNNMLKTSSLLTFIGVAELFSDAQRTYSRNFDTVEVLFAVALWYLVLTTIWAFIQLHIERHLSRSERADADEAWHTRWFGIGGERRDYA